MGVLYFFAFASYWIQFEGLIGSEGISPAADFFAFMGTRLPFLERSFNFPSLCWFSASDFSLHLQFFLGCCCALCAALNVIRFPALIGCWALYLSLSIAGQEFLGFQWDSLLLETGFIAILLQSRFRTGNPALLAAPFFLLRWLLFRLYFGSGIVKLLSGDETWNNLTALVFHYETQPLPTPLGYFLHHAPLSFQKFSTGLTLCIELVVPFFIFAPFALRRLAGIILIGLQIVILATGNYAYFNLLTIVLCLSLFPMRIGVQEPASAAGLPLRLSRLVKAPLYPLLFLLSALVFAESIAGFEYPERIRVGTQIASRFRIANNYGLFARMTTTRFEILVEGSADGETWLPYQFRWKPEALNQPPPVVAPHQPRLDWQMWFAALGPVQASPWFIAFSKRLLEGKPQVTRLLAVNPFAGHPPRYVRALLYHYTFSTNFERETQGRWWNRELVGTFLPEIMLDADNQIRRRIPETIQADQGDAEQLQTEDPN